MTGATDPRSRPPWELLVVGNGGGHSRIRGVIHADTSEGDDEKYTVRVTRPGNEGLGWVTTDREIEDVRVGLPADMTFPAGTVVWIERYYGFWYITNAACGT